MTEGLVLASASTVRAGLLAAASVNFRIKPAELDEGFIKRACRAEGRAAADCTLALAEAKARQVAGRCGRAAVIGADQLLVCGEVRYGSTSPRVSGRPAPNFRLCVAALTSLSRQSARFRTDRDYDMP
jgi:predicted house-cleaning NTP pyrophosphatase (Maf/HAM1 superfamily)